MVSLVTTRTVRKNIPEYLDRWSFWHGSAGKSSIGTPSYVQTLADSRQTPTGDFQASELDAGFHFLYELKFEEARNQFEAWQKSHPEGPLGSASERRAICYSTTINIRGESYRLKERRKAGLVPAREQEASGVQLLGLGLRSAQNAPKDGAGLHCVRGQGGSVIGFRNFRPAKWGIFIRL